MDYMLILPGIQSFCGLYVDLARNAIIYSFISDDNFALQCLFATRFYARIIIMCIKLKHVGG